MFVLQEKVRELQIEVSSKNSEIAVAKREIEELNRNTVSLFSLEALNVISVNDAITNQLFPLEGHISECRRRCQRALCNLCILATGVQPGAVVLCRILSIFKFSDLLTQT